MLGGLVDGNDENVFTATELFLMVMEMQNKEDLLANAFIAEMVKKDRRDGSAFPIPMRSSVCVILLIKQFSFFDLTFAKTITTFRQVNVFVLLTANT